ncbi:MAG: 50S ribosomal protein L16 [Holosporales bacterium]|jgi:large subunit ribosomal protein L16|nr:50S ribosomal protein L16 [Holosporales bacterium]
MMFPKKTKFRKAFKGKIKGFTIVGSSVSYGSYGLKAIEPARLTARQIEAARRAISKYVKRAGRVWIRIFPDIPVSKRPAEVRMGKGKGSNDHWAVRVHPGRVMFELDGVSEETAEEALTLAASKLPIRAKFVRRIV